LRDDGLLPGFFVFPSLTQKAADKNRSSQKPPAVWICARTYGKWATLQSARRWFHAFSGDRAFAFWIRADRAGSALPYWVQSPLNQCKTPLLCSHYWLQFNTMIKSFADAITEKIFRGDDLTKKESRQLGDIRIDKAQERLLILHHSAEKDLLTLHSLHYHKLHGTGRYSIDANSRNSKWRITFAWADQALTDVSLVKIEDTH
jgi:plasmid maintenance system killer protein